MYINTPSPTSGGRLNSHPYPFTLADSSDLLPELEYGNENSSFIIENLIDPNLSQEISLNVICNKSYCYHMPFDIKYFVV